MHSIHTDNTNRSSTAFDLYPDFCPVCHRTAEIVIVSKIPYIFPLDGSNSQRWMQLLFQCPSRTCGTQFLVEYEKSFNQGVYYSAHRIYPKIHKEAPIADGISEISPRFVTILQEATIADANNLNEVSGIGYRKALEFLVKDYCIHKNPVQAVAIRASQLGACINDFVVDANVKECARRAAWLGNDEAHYERFWTEHDVRDLKMLIQLTQNWISNELLTKKYLEELEKPSAKAKGQKSLR